MTCAPGAYPAGAADRRWARRYLPAARPGFHPQAIACHRVLHELLTPEVRGLDRLPTEGPALVVGNHSCLFYMPEVWTWGQAILSHRGIGAPAHVLAYDLLFALPRVGSSLRRLGVVPASTGEAESALARGACVLVYPGGDREACRPWTQRNKVDFAGRCRPRRPSRRRGASARGPAGPRRRTAQTADQRLPPPGRPSLWHQHHPHPATADASAPHHRVPAPARLDRIRPRRSRQHGHRRRLTRATPPASKTP